MELVNKTTLNFFVEQSGKLGRSLLTVKPPKNMNIEDFKYMPQQLSADVVEFSQKAMQQDKSEINPATLQELADKGLSLNEMAKELGVKIGKLRRHLKKNDIVTDSQKKYRAIKKYVSATTQEEKSKAFKVIDEHLQEIAKEKLKLHKGYSYEDCLQDVRLRFFELMAKKESGLQLQSGIFKMVQESTPISGKKRIKTVGLDKLTQKDIGFSDIGTELVEENDSRNYFSKKLKDVLTQRELYLLKLLYTENKTIEQIAECFGIKTERTKFVLKKATCKTIYLQEKMFKQENEYIQKKINIAMDQNKKHDLSKEANGYRFVDGRYALKKCVSR